MNPEHLHSRLPEGATHHHVCPRGVQRWIQPYGESTIAAVARVRVLDEEGEWNWLQHGVVLPESQFSILDETTAEIRRYSLIDEAMAVIYTALDFLEEHGPAAYRAMVEEQERELNSSATE